jgi:hypothetical protein
MPIRVPLHLPALRGALDVTLKAVFYVFCGAIKQWGMAATLIYRRKINKYDFYANSIISKIAKYIAKQYNPFPLQHNRLFPFLF